MQGRFLHGRPRMLTRNLLALSNLLFDMCCASRVVSGLLVTQGRGARVNQSSQRTDRLMHRCASADAKPHQSKGTTSAAAIHRKEYRRRHLTGRSYDDICDVMNLLTWVEQRARIERSTSVACMQQSYSFWTCFVKTRNSEDGISDTV